MRKLVVLFLPIIILLFSCNDVTSPVVEPLAKWELISVLDGLDISLYSDYQ